jgi:hypothetical protein
MTQPLATAPMRRSFGERIVAAMKLDPGVYDEVEHDPTSMGQAAGVVVLAAVAAGIGGAGGMGVASLVGGMIGSVLGWLASTAVVWLIGVRFMNHTSDYAELLRTLGFATAPRLIAVLGFIPVLGFLALLAAAILGLVAYVIAVRQALDVSTGRAIVVCVLAYLVGIALVVGLMVVAGIGTPAGPSA